MGSRAALHWAAPRAGGEGRLPLPLRSQAPAPFSFVCRGFYGMLRLGVPFGVVGLWGGVGVYFSFIFIKIAKIFAIPSVELHIHFYKNF